MRHSNQIAAVVRCNAVCPGWIETTLVNNYFKSTNDMERVHKALRTLHPSGRLGTPADVANLASWLASDEAAWVTGQGFTLDGGRLARLSGADFENAERPSKVIHETL